MITDPLGVNCDFTSTSAPGKTYLVPTVVTDYGGVNVVKRSIWAVPKNATGMRPPYKQHMNRSGVEQA
jgi:hypothetical protein